MDAPKQIDLEKGIVTLKKGEETKQYSLKSEDDLKRFVNEAQQGWYFSTEASRELGELRKTVQNWDQMLEAARTDPNAAANLKQKIELAIGRPLSAKEDHQVDQAVDKSDGKILFDEEDDARLKQALSPFQRKIEELERKLAAAEQSEKERRDQELTRELNAEADKLEKQFPGDDGKPKFERDKVFKFAAENGIGDLKLAFRAMTFDQWTEAVKKNTLDEMKKQENKRKGAQVETTGDGPAGVDLHASKSKRRSYRDVGLDALGAARSEGISLFTSDD